MEDRSGPMERNSLWLLVVLGLIVVLCVATVLFDGTLVERMSFPLG